MTREQTTKWLHRQFKWIIPFGRACLIPNLRYYFCLMEGSTDLCCAVATYPKQRRHFWMSG